jgi:hypothetical protein
MSDLDDPTPRAEYRAMYHCCPGVDIEATSKGRISLNGVEVRLQDVSRVIRGLTLAMEHTEALTDNGMRTAWEKGKGKWHD